MNYLLQNKVFNPFKANMMRFDSCVDGDDYLISLLFELRIPGWVSNLRLSFIPNAERKKSYHVHISDFDGSSLERLFWHENDPNVTRVGSNIEVFNFDECEDADERFPKKGFLFNDDDWKIVKGVNKDQYLLSIIDLGKVVFKKKLLLSTLHPLRYQLYKYGVFCRDFLSCWRLQFLENDRLRGYNETEKSYKKGWRTREED